MSTLTISIIQTSLFWEDPEANLAMLGKKIMDIKEPTEIVLLPEMFSTGFSMQPAELAEQMDGRTVNWMRQLAAKRKVVVAGSVIIAEDGNFFNRLIWMLPNGQFGYYDKRHRFAYAGEDKEYTAGNKRLIASVKGWKVNLQICYDLRFPVWARQHATAGTPEFDILIYVANWPEKRQHAWKTLLAARAIENQCYVVGVNRVGKDGNGHLYNGGSQVIDPLGESLYFKEGVEDVHTITIERSGLDEVRERFPFWRDADNFTIL